MISIRHRLLAALLALFGLVWIATATWIFLDLRQEIRSVLDGRLVQAAQMVQGLLARQALLPRTETPPGARTELPPLPSVNRPDRLACQVLTIEGLPIAASEGAPRATLAELASGFADREVGGTAWRVYALTDSRLGVRILVAERHEPRRRLVRDVALGLMVPFGVLIPLTAVLVWFGLGRGLKPLAHVSQTIEQRAPDSLAPVPTAQTPREVLPLVASINRLFARLSAAFERERRFTADAAHELRTPLAALKTHLQVAQATHDSEARARSLAQVEKAVDRAARLVEQLLVLARLDAGAAVSAPETADADDVARATIAELAPFAETRGVRIRFVGAGRRAPIPMPAPLLAIAVRNLIDNAVRYMPRAGKVRVTVAVAPPGVRIDVHDEGPGIPEDELARVRERFYRGAEVRAEGSGLGLSIVERIAERHGLTLVLANRQPRGLTASLAYTGETPASSRNAADA